MERAAAQQLQADRDAVEARLAQALVAGDCPAELLDASRYAVLGGGKRLRACMVLESARACAANPQAALDAAAAIEAMHAYSLVHDDHPDMDDDALRRGKPTVHIKYDNATAILVGDGLQTLAFDLVSNIKTAPADRVLRLTADLAKASGIWGMVGGQARDMESERRLENPDAPMMSHDAKIADIALIQRLKTGALFEWSACAGAVLAGVDRTPFLDYARAMGLAFQLRDDLLDVEGDAAEVGKAVGKDAVAGKATYVDLLGVEATRAKAQGLINSAISALAPLGKRGDVLAEIARFTLTRSH